MKENRNKLVTPSILNVEKEKRIDYVNSLIDLGISWFHYDVMDAKFVENTAIEVDEIIKISKKTKSHIKDVHLMVENPYEYVDKLKGYVDIFTFHYEAIENDLDKFEEFLELNKHNLRIGLAINPETDVERVFPFLEKLTLVLVMSVNPGKGGQAFIESALDKIKKLKFERLNLRKNYEYLIQVDGGINNLTGPKCFKKGANLCVVGSFLVKSPTKETINSIFK
ncbi:ribulose-phosphate 3-epimerase [Mycoplasmopsis synoviae]|uniref:Ribulose-phosphate 3-epimerase n=2 Tax=Mycoplasmopsis synoviae TaxID=2109 RepID=A0AAN1EE11_MYCSY|nr:ribulose-phosphate 3-epimerase [Mycoplasmopsis synoviae]AKJ21047.1 Ribulose-phosphate 3-epimerase [Mycoplasmopsis synoviae]AQU48384.1 Ribulose-phosphate 3-epimerase [Mycoplasmopsis synoviae]AWL83955.1 ribulose-phosphate 3-epimerase [Mycoplasmopsis synoviae]QLE13684.1 ribulose-phosphate 3-epimerase [Mycoplasmopsis synoviae]UZF64442.1 ribulose-phosphate 3-epimerase [Mycoplasmopsis synoviae]